MATIRKKTYNKTNVLEESLNRIRYCYNNFDNIEVSFSGGKDSTAVLNLTLKVAEEMNRLPLVLNFYDEEAIHPTTIEYVERVRQNPKVKLNWWCLEFQHRNACSNEEPFWYTWEKEKKDIWVRELPEGAITFHPEFIKGMTLVEFAEKRVEKCNGQTMDFTGVRTQESLRRLMMISTKVNDNYITRINHYNKAHPIYDWSSQDVWKLVNDWGIDYNKTYDIYNKTKLYNKFLTQRVCPPFGEEPLRGLWVYSECFPEMWHKMINRVSGVATAWRYANTEIYGCKTISKPDNVTWKEYLQYILDTYSGKEKETVSRNINSYIKQHNRCAKDKLENEIPNMLTGISYSWLCKIAIKGDFKGRQGVTTIRAKIQNKAGITRDEAVLRYGNQNYIKEYFDKKKNGK